MFAQLCSLERRTARGGKDSIDHAPRARRSRQCNGGPRLDARENDDFDESYEWVFGRKDPPPPIPVAATTIFSISSAPAVIAAVVIDIRERNTR